MSHQEQPDSLICEHSRDRVICGHVLDVLRTMPDGFVHAVVTSVPSWRKKAKKAEGEKWPGSLKPVPWPDVTFRAYPFGPEVEISVPDVSLGLEATLDAYVGHVVTVVRELARVLRDDGSMWLVLEDEPGPRGNLLGPQRVMLALQTEFSVIPTVWLKTEVRPAGALGKTRPVMAHEYAVLVRKLDAKPFYDYFAMNESTAEAARRGATRSFGETERGGLQALYAGPGDGEARHARDVVITHGASDLSPALARRLVAAAAPVGQCCAVCGAPRIRDVSVTPKFHGPAQKNGKGGFPSIKAPEVVAEGWKLNCEHLPQSVTPAIILDPFMGDGTVLREAAAERMRVIGIDVDPERVKAGAGILDRADGRGQHSLFEEAFK